MIYQGTALNIFPLHFHYGNIKFVRFSSLVCRYSIKFEIVFSLNDKDNNIFPCLHIISLSYNI